MRTILSHTVRQREQWQNNPSIADRIIGYVINSPSVRDVNNEALEGIMRRSEEYWRLKLQHRVVKKAGDIITTCAEYNDYSNEQAKYLHPEKLTE